jgi:cation:H+ antiporter
MDILLLIGGLLLILIGANCLTDGAASVAKRFRIPDYRSFRNFRPGTDR